MRVARVGWGVKVRSCADGGLARDDDAARMAVLRARRERDLWRLSCRSLRFGRDDSIWVERAGSWSVIGGSTKPTHRARRRAMNGAPPFVARDNERRTGGGLYAKLMRRAMPGRRQGRVLGGGLRGGRVGVSCVKRRGSLRPMRRMSRGLPGCCGLVVARDWMTNSVGLLGWCGGQPWARA